MTKRWVKRAIAGITLFAAMGANAQISSPVGEYQGGGSKDTAHFVDKPSMHVHEQTTVIPVKGAKKENENTSRGQAPVGNPIDTSAQASGRSQGSDTVGTMNNGEVSGGANNAAYGSAASTTVEQVRNLGSIYAALAAFGIGALIGLFLITMIFRDKKSPTWLAILHGVFGIVGIALLIVYSLNYSGPVVSIVIFSIAATGGAIVFYKDISNKPIPKWLAVTHGVIAVAGIISLIAFALTA